MRNKHYIITLSIIIVFALMVVIWTFNCVNISEDRRWVDLAQTFLYPLCYTITGSAIIAYAGLEISDKVLENYNKRIGYGLSNRQIYFEGSARKISEIKEDLQVSDLIRRENYMGSTASIYDADIAILCIQKTYRQRQKTDPTDPSGRKVDTPEYADWKKEANNQIVSLRDSLSTQQALIVYTNGWLDQATKDTINDRPFSVLVNFRGRIVSDIHSLLTVLPPRNRE